MTDVAIIGVGFHPFGRHGDKTAIQMGARATEDALADAGIDWKDVQYASVGAWTSQPRRGHRPLGLTGIPFHRRVQRVRHRGQRAWRPRPTRSASVSRHRPRDRHGQAPAGRVRRRSPQYSMPTGTARTGST